MCNYVLPFPVHLLFMNLLQLKGKLEDLEQRWADRDRLYSELQQELQARKGTVQALTAEKEEEQRKVELLKLDKVRKMS